MVGQKNEVSHMISSVCLEREFPGSDTGRRTQAEPRELPELKRWSRERVQGD